MAKKRKQAMQQSKHIGMRSDLSRTLRNYQGHYSQQTGHRARSEFWRGHPKRQQFLEVQGKV